MNKMLKRVLCLILSLGLVMGLLTVAGAEETNVRQFRKYCSIGDSVAYGLLYENESGTYPRIVGRAVGAVKKDGSTDESLHLQFCGARVKDMLVALGVDPIDEADPYYDGGARNTNWYKEYRKNGYEKKIQKADLITLELGINDVLYYAFDSLDIDTLISEDATLSEKTDAVKVGLAALKEGYASFCRNYTRLLDRIVELKAGQTYTMVLVGVYNSSNFLTPTEDILLPICQALSLYTSQMNKRIKQAAKDYGFLYADISNVEIGAMAYSMSITALTDDYSGSLCSHPSYPDGYAYIARQILDQLVVEKPEPDTNIRIDLGPVKTVSSVMVDSVVIPSSRYTYDTDSRLLTVECETKLANLLTVFSEENGKRSVYVYQLSYHEGEGYQGWLLYQTKDITRLFTSKINLMKKGISSIAAAFGK